MGRARIASRQAVLEPEVREVKIIEPVEIELKGGSFVVDGDKMPSATPLEIARQVAKFLAHTNNHAGELRVALLTHLHELDRPDLDLVGREFVQGAIAEAFVTAFAFGTHGDVSVPNSR